MKKILLMILPLALISFGSVAEAKKPKDDHVKSKPPRGAPAPLLGAALPAAGFAAAAYVAWRRRSNRVMAVEPVSEIKLPEAS